MPVSKLITGAAEYDDEIVARSGGLRMSHAMIGETLAIDALTIHIRTQDLPVRILAADQGPNDFLKTADGKILCVRGGAPTPVFKKHDPGFFYFGEDLIGKYLLKEQRQLSAYKYEQVRYSAIYLLSLTKHFGGMYSGELFSEVWADVVGGTIPYTIDDDIASIPIYQYLPYDWRRENARKLLMAAGAALRNNPDGSIRVTSLSDSVTGTFGADRVFRGGSVIDQTPVTAVEVTEHNFVPTNEETVLYENATISTETVVFSEPAHDLTIENGAILASGVNYCTFSGSGAVKITGKKYLHITRIVRYGEAPTGTAEDNIQSISDNTLIGPLNAAEIAEKVYKYLTSTTIIKEKVIFGSERPGDVVKIIHPYTGELVEAAFKSASLSFGATEIRATGEFIVGYKPPGAISGFQNHQLLTGAGTFVAPDKNGDGSPYPGRLILFGAGDGGHGGINGESSVAGMTGQGAPGGNGGEAGLGGRILEINITLIPGHEYIYDCGIGGEGGDPETDGEPGTDTTFGDFSSALGRRYPSGYVEQKTGQTFCADGIDGVPGGRGNNAGDPGPSITHNGVTYYPGTNGQSQSMIVPPGVGATAAGGGGGGAAVGNNGGNGGNGYFSGFTPIHGAGGNGADAIDADDAEGYGAGGNGGHGGGGGGYRASSSGGYGGLGSRGSKGGDGVIMIYW